MELIKPDINLDFIGKRMLAFGISALLVLVTVASLVYHQGPNYGIDFAGGILVQVKFKQPTDPASIKRALAPIGLADALVQRYGVAEANEFLIRAQKADVDLSKLTEQVEKALAARYKGDMEVRRAESVGPKVGAELRQKALLAIFSSLLFIMIYISGRFEGKWAPAILMAALLGGISALAYWVFTEIFSLPSGQVIVYLILVALGATLLACWVMRLRYAMGAMVALIHDVFLTVGLFSVLDKEFTLATVAALLTIIGYSLNDTIVVFDRIRENLKKPGRQELDQVINVSVNQTLSRTLLTSGTTLIVLICLYLLGGGVIEDFALALLAGVIVGTYSSIYVASPVVLAMPASGPALALLGGSQAKAPTPAARPKPSRRAPATEAPEQAPAQETRPAPRVAKVAAAQRRKKSKTRARKKKKKR